MRMYDSIQEPYPHHTVICLKCKHVYNRKSPMSKKCPKCGNKYEKILKSEFHKSKLFIYTGKNMERMRK